MTADEQRRADDLIDEPAGERAQERLRIRRPDAGRALRADDLRASAVERVQRLVIRRVDDRRRDERAGQLRDRVGQHLAPREIAVDGERQRDRRVQMRAGHPARHVAPHRHRQAPGDVDRRAGCRRRCLLRTAWATTPTPKMIRTNVPRNSASSSRRSSCIFFDMDSSKCGASRRVADSLREYIAARTRAAPEFD